MVVVLALSAALSSYGCFQPDEPSNVEFGAKPVQFGRWQATDTPPTAGMIADFPAQNDSLVPSAGQPSVAVAGRTAVAEPAGTGVAGSQTTVAGSFSAGTGSVVAGIGAAGGRGGASAAGVGASGTGAAGTGAAGSGAAGMAPEAGSGGSSAADSVTMLAFDVTTLSQGGRYQPRNIGAIWVADAQGRFVKSLEVWARIRSRYLTKYNAARSGMAVDVTASATLSSHRAHHASWDMKDSTGAVAPPGKYTVFVELTDADVTGKFTSVDFDTSLGPQTINPPNATYYTNMKLQLQ